MQDYMLKSHLEELELAYRANPTPEILDQILALQEQIRQNEAQRV